MISLRGKTLTLRPLDLADIGQVMDSVVTLSAFRTTAEMTSAKTFPHLLRVIGVGVRKEMPNATTEEIREALTPANIKTVLLALIGQSPNLRLNQSDESTSTRH